MDGISGWTLVDDMGDLSQGTKILTHLLVTVWRVFMIFMVSGRRRLKGTQSNMQMLSYSGLMERVILLFYRHLKVKYRLSPVAVISGNEGH